MDFQYTKKIIFYNHKLSAFRYSLSDPFLTFCISPKLSDFYFNLTLHRLFGKNRVFQPTQLNSLMDGLSSKGYYDLERINTLLFLIVRFLRPKIVVETGVARGASSAFILSAMNENQLGQLYSIDLPASSSCIKTEYRGNWSKFYVLEDNQIQNEHTIGELVPEHLKKRWTLIEGDARYELPILLKKIGNIDLFFHDSLHTYDQMTFEFENSWPYLNDSGFLLSHDILWNNAFLDFSKKANRKFILYFSLGIIRK